MKKVYLAIDAHARHCTLGKMSARGKFERSWTFSTSEKELIKHVEAIEAKKILAVEEGPLAYWIAQTLRPYVHELIIADPRENPLISRNAMKRDKVDVKQLCRLLRLGELKRVYHPQDDKRAIFKAAMQQYLDFRDQETSFKQKIKAKYRSWGVPDVEGTCVYHPKKRDDYLVRIKAIPIRNQLKRMYTLLDHALMAQRLALKDAWQLGNKYPEIKEFMKVPGVGVIGSLLYDSYIQTPHRFVKKSQLFRYCQLGVTDRSSDNKPLAYKRLDKAGNSELKAMSYRAFTSAMRIKRDNEVRSFYEASLSRTRNHTRARLNTQRKILSVLHGIWRSGQEYKSEMFLGSN